MNLTLGRPFAIVLAAALFLTCAACLRQASQGDQMCADAAQIELASISDAFRAPGVHTARFHQKYSFTCQQVLVMQYHPPSEAWLDALSVVDGLSGELSITDGSGKTIYAQPLDCPRPISADLETHGVWPGYLFPPVSTGDYTLNLLITTNTPQTASIPHRVVLKYDVCGLEYFPVTVMRCLGIASLVIGAIVGCIGLFAKRRSKMNPNHGIEPNSPSLSLRAVAHAGRWMLK